MDYGDVSPLERARTVSQWPEATILILIGLCLFEETYLRFLACSQNYLREHIHVFSRSAGIYRLLPVQGNMSIHHLSFAIFMTAYMSQQNAVTVCSEQFDRAIVGDVRLAS